jgi:eukaryotic-like serine/threonine-protein kinase
LGSPAIRQLVRFGPFEFDTESGELRRHGIPVQLQPKVQELLATLIENRGKVISREELQRRLWDDGTFVDFESGLNTTANRLRIKLGDSATGPRYVETLPRVGYRFIAPVESVDSEELTAPQPGEQSISHSAPRQSRRAVILAVAAVVLLGAAAVSFSLYLTRSASVNRVRFRELTFQRGQVLGARFMPDGQSILYTAQWENGPRQLFIVNRSGPESRPMGFADLSLASVSRNSELALISFGGTMNIAGGTLLRVPLTGSAPSFVDHGVMSADWTRDGQSLALVRAIDGKNQLESPAGNVVFRTSGWLSNPRHSPDSARIAFIEHSFRHDDSGRVMLFERGKGVRELSAGWVSVSGLAWRSQEELWFTASRDDQPRSVWSVTLNSKIRPVAQAPGVLTLRDITSSGNALLTRDTRRLEMAGRLKADGAERNISWLGWSRVQELSGDAQLLLFDESGDATGNRPVTYVRDNRTGSVARLSSGVAMSFTPQADFALIGSEDRQRLALVPVGGGAPRWLPAVGLRYQWARVLPDGRRLLVLASRPQQPLRLYVQPLDGSMPVAISPETMIRNAAISPGGDQVAALAPNNRFVLYATMSSAQPRVIETEEPLAPLRWMPDGKSIIVQHLRRASDNSAQLSRLDISTGSLVPWMKLQPSDIVGVNSITGVVLSRDCQSYVYSYRRVLSEMFVAEGWR